MATTNPKVTPYLPPTYTLEIILTHDLQKTRKLIILLMGNEIDHIIAWTNPQNRIALQIAEEHRFSTAKVANWKEFITTAWEISPRLCIHMCKRFPNSKNLRKFLERKVRENASAVLDVSEAVTFLVTEANVAANIPELKVTQQSYLDFSAIFSIYYTGLTQLPLSHWASYTKTIMGIPSLPNMPYAPSAVSLQKPSFTTSHNLYRLFDTTSPVRTPPISRLTYQASYSSISLSQPKRAK
jgi:hypothetical protein